MQSSFDSTVTWAGYKCSSWSLSCNNPPALANELVVAVAFSYILRSKPDVPLKRAKMFGLRVRLPLMWLSLALPAVLGLFDSSKPFYLTAQLPLKVYATPTVELELFVCPARFNEKPILCIATNGAPTAAPIQAHLSNDTIQTTVRSNGTAGGGTTQLCSFAAKGASTAYEGHFGPEETVEFAVLECGAAHLHLLPGATTKIDQDGRVDPAWADSAHPKVRAWFELCPYTNADVPEHRYRALSFTTGYSYRNDDCWDKAVIYARNVPA